MIPVCFKSGFAGLLVSTGRRLCEIALAFLVSVQSAICLSGCINEVSGAEDLVISSETSAYESLDFVGLWVCQEEGGYDLLLLEDGVCKAYPITGTFINGYKVEDWPDDPEVESRYASGYLGDWYYDQDGGILETPLGDLTIVQGPSSGLLEVEGEAGEDWFYTLSDDKEEYLLALGSGSSWSGSDAGRLVLGIYQAWGYVEGVAYSRWTITTTCGSRSGFPITLEGSDAGYVYMWVEANDSADGMLYSYKLYSNDDWTETKVSAAYAHSSEVLGEGTVELIADDEFVALVLRFEGAISGEFVRDAWYSGDNVREGSEESQDFCFGGQKPSRGFPQASLAIISNK